MALLASINIHLEREPITVAIRDFTDQDFVTLVLSDPKVYGDLTIFFPRRSLPQVHEIARLIEAAIAEPKKVEAA